MMVRIDKVTIAEVNRVQEQVQANHKGRRVSREGVIRELLQQATRTPKILRAVGAGVVRSAR